MKGNQKMQSVISAAMLAAAATASYAQTTYYSESFNGAARNQQAQDPSCPGNVGVWTDVFPAGWVVDDCGVPTYYCRKTLECTTMPNRVNCATCTVDPVTGPRGVLEWEGWAIASKSWWAEVAGGQNRELFNDASGNVAVADPDEWDDQGNPDNDCGYYNAFMTSPQVSLSGVDLATLNFSLASAWRPEAFDDGTPATNNQTGTIVAIFSTPGGEVRREVLKYTSVETESTFKTDTSTEVVTIAPTVINAPIDATSVKFEFSLTNAGNDWFWAVDNLVLSGMLTGGGSPVTLFSENFDSPTITLRPAADETPNPCATQQCTATAFTHTGPSGSTVTVTSPASGGVADWAGWSFVSREYWNCVTGSGTDFLLGDGLIAVADGSAFDDAPHAPGELQTLFKTPRINISARTTSTLAMSFDSSWRPAGAQTATVVATYYAGGSSVVGTQTVLSWSSVLTDTNYKVESANEIVGAGLIVPAGASTVELSFSYTGGNDAWWAIDDVKVFQGEVTVAIGSTAAPQTNFMALGESIDYTGCTQPYAADAPLGWTESFVTKDFAGNPYCDTNNIYGTCGRPEWQGWAFPHRQWWASTSVDLQRRQEFVLGIGRVAVADPDEWDDRPSGQAEFNSYMTTPVINLPGSITDVALNFASSWRPEALDDGTFGAPLDSEGGPIPSNNQTATVKAIYQTAGGEVTRTAMLWTSVDTESTYHDHAPNEQVSLGATQLDVPAGATSVKFEFSLTRARNDWWWAVDNVNLVVNGSTLFTEDFEDAQNPSAPITEGPAVFLCQYFSEVSEQPVRFTLDNSLIGTCGGAAAEFNGWGSWVTGAWAAALGGRRGEFLPTTAFVSDFAAGNCDGTTCMVSPSYAIAGLNAGSVKLTFNSGWLNEAGHISTVEVSLDGGAYTPVLTWDSNTKATNTNEVVVVNVNNAATNSNMRVRFCDKDAGWWAVSNIAVSGTVGTNPPPCTADYNNSGSVTVQDIFDFLAGWFAGDTQADVNNSGAVTVQDIFDFLSAWFGGCA